MTAILNQPNLTEGLSLIGWKLKRDAEIQARKNEANFECEVEPSSTSYAAFEYMSTTDDNYDPHSDLNLDLCLEVDAIDLNNSSSQQTNDDYDPYEIFMRINTRRTLTGRDRAPLALLPSQSTTTSTSSLVNNYRHYNFADDDTPVKYPLAIGLIDRHLKQPQKIESRGGIRRPISSSRQYPSNSSLKRVTFRQSEDDDDDDDDEDNFENDLRHQNKLLKRSTTRIGTQRFRSNMHRSSLIDDDLDDDIAPTVTEMDMLDDEEDNEPITKLMSSPVKLPPPPTANKSSSTKSSYIGNILPSFYEQLPQSKKMLLQDATVDSSSNGGGGGGGEEIIDEDNRLQFHNTTTRSNNIQIRKRNRIYEDDDEEYDINQDAQQQQTIRVPARRGRPPSQHHYQEDPSKLSARIIAQYEEQHAIKLGDIRVFAPKLRLRISSVNVNWINLPPIPKFPNKVHHS